MDDDDDRVVLVDPVARRERPDPDAQRLFDVEDEAETDEIEGGGAFPRLPIESPPAIELSPTDRREVCRTHGWVGRMAFQRERHDLCAWDEREPCQACDGKGKASRGPCSACNGTGRVAIADSEDDEHDDDGELDVEQTEQSGDPPRVMIKGRRLLSRMRNPEVLRAKSFSMKHLTIRELREEESKIATFTASKEYAELIKQRPVTRGDCRDGQRPCAWISCSQHLFLEVSAETGSIKINFPGRELHELPATCALDVADEGEHTLEQVGEYNNLTRERVRQLEVRGLLKLKFDKKLHDRDK